MLPSPNMLAVLLHDGSEDDAGNKGGQNKSRILNFPTYYSIL